MFLVFRIGYVTNRVGRVSGKAFALFLLDGKTPQAFCSGKTILISVFGNHGFTGITFKNSHEKWRIQISVMGELCGQA